MAKKKSDTATQVRSPIDSPDFTKPEVTALAKLRSRCRDLFGSDVASGTDMMHERADVYLPKWAGEDKHNYKVRSTMTELYSAFERCVVAGVGLVFAKPPALSEKASEQMKAHWEDIDATGTHADVFLRDVFTDRVVDGPGSLFIEYPKVDAPETLSLDEREKLGLRPRWVKVMADQIINWRYGKVGGRTKLTMLVIHECVDDVLGEFGSTEVEQYRVFQLGIVPERVGGNNTETGVFYTVWRYRDEIQGQIKKRVWFIHDQGRYLGVSRIPVAVGRKLLEKPPLVAMADLNIGHYRVSADRRYMIALVHAPTPVITGYVEPTNADGSPAPQDEMILGPGSAMKLPPGQTFLFVQADPEGLDASKEEKDDLIAQMSAMSIAFLSQERKAQETATAHSIAAAAQNATLAVAARGLQDLIEEALEIHAEYLREEAPEVTVQTTYDEAVLDAQTIQALNQLETDANLTKGTLLTILKRGKVLPDDLDVVKEEDLLIVEAAARRQIEMEALAPEADEPPADRKKKAAKRPPPKKRAKKATA